MNGEIKSLTLRNDTLSHKRNLTTVCGVVILGAFLGIHLDQFPYLNGKILAPEWAVQIAGILAMAYFATVYWLTYKRDKSDWQESSELEKSHLEPIETWRSDVLSEHPQSASVWLNNLSSGRFSAQEIFEAENPKQVFQDLAIPESLWNTHAQSKMRFVPALARAHEIIRKRKILLDSHTRYSLRVNEWIPLGLLGIAVLCSLLRIVSIVRGWPHPWDLIR